MALPCAAQITQERATLSAGGGTLTAPQYTLTGTVGQASPVGVLTSTTYTLQAGVWAGKSFTLSVELAGPGSGTVKDCSADDTCAGERINCGEDCLAFYTEGESVLLRAFPKPESSFGGWLINGAPPIGGAIYMTRDVVVTATFTGKIDTDNDTLADDWEQQMIDADPLDAIVTITDVQPDGDFDGDGLTNAEEFWNEVDPTLPTDVLAEITTDATEADWMQPVRVTAQLRFRQDHRPAKLVRRVTLFANNGSRFESKNMSVGQLDSSQTSVFPGRVHLITNADGQAALPLRSLTAGRTAITVEALQGGVIAPASVTLSAGRSAFLNAAWKGRQLVFPAGQESISIRIADFAAALHPDFAYVADAAWSIGGLAFDRVRIGKTGYLLLGDQPALTTTDQIWTTAPNGLLAPLLDDLVFTPESQVFIAWDWWTEPYFVVEWCKLAHTLDPTASYRFQIQLWQRSGQARFVYEEMRNGTGAYADGHAAFIGMKFAADKVYQWTAPLQRYASLDLFDANAAIVTVQAPDADDDLLSRADELAIGTNPNVPDTDGDRMYDGWEHTFMSKGITPLQPDAGGDLDGDGYANLVEYYLGSKPDDPSSPSYPASNPDTDKDGMPDAWETQHGLNPQSAADAVIDTDHDWYCNVLEYAIGGDPTDPTAHGNHPFEPDGGMSHAVYP